MNILKKWWLSWYHLEEYGEFELSLPWWWTGERLSDGAQTICAAVKAMTEKGAETIIYEAYDTRPENIEFRFVNERPDDWSPFGDRFQRAEWMKW